MSRIAWGSTLREEFGYTPRPPSRSSTRPFFATLLIGLLGKEETDVKATSNCRYLCIQVRSPLTGLCRIQLGVASKALPLQVAAISSYRHGCQTFDGEAFLPNHALLEKALKPDTGWETLNLIRLLVSAQAVLIVMFEFFQVEMNLCRSRRRGFHDPHLTQRPPPAF